MISLKIHMAGFHRGDRGQAMTEFCIAGPLLVLLLWSLIYMTEMFIVKHETLVAARYGTWLLSRNDNIPKKSIDIDQVTQLITKNFFNNKSAGLTVTEQHLGSDTNNGGFSSRMNSQSGSGSWIDKIVGFIGDGLMGTDTPNVYSLKVEREYPRIFGAVDLTENSSQNFKIVSEHYVLGNSWDGQRVETHDLIDMLESLVKKMFDGLKKK